MSMKLKPAVVAGAVAAGLFTIGAVQAATVTLYGGGATLPAIAYVGPSFFSTNQRLTSPADAGSLFGAYTSKTFGHPLVSYCQTGSGTGRKVEDGDASANGTCPDFTQTPTGFAVPSGKDMDFAASDAPLNSSEYTKFINNKSATHVEPWQFPVISGSIAMVYNNGNVTSQLNLTDAQVCQIANGTITNWSQLGFPSKALTFVYRSDGSGTTFSMTNHLSAVCSGFKTTGTWAGVAGDALNPPAVNSGVVGVSASGNPGVVTKIAATDGAIGYGEVADALLHNPALTYAKVDGKDPVADFTAAPAFTKLTDVTLGAVDANGRPTTVAVSPSKAGCLVVANPADYANPSSGYPIVAVSYLMGYQKGNPNYSKIRNLVKAPFTSSIKKVTTTVGAGTGFAFLDSGDAPTYSQRTGCIAK
jgi:ABC-type phosphate transport system substrate-binding protein